MSKLQKPPFSSSYSYYSSYYGRRLRNALPRRTTVAVVATAAVALTIELKVNRAHHVRSTPLYHTVADQVVTPLLRRCLDPEGTFRHHNVTDVLVYILTYCIEYARTRKTKRMG